MSLRPEMFGFRFAALQSLMGSRNQEALLKLAAASDGLLDFECPAELEAIISRAVLEGVPFNDLSVESSDHVTAATLLVRYTQDLMTLDSHAWKMEAFSDLLDATRGRCDSTTDHLLGSFSSGRPLFGPRIDSSWSIYGYLLRTEIRLILENLKRLRQSTPMFRSPNFLDGFLEALMGWFQRLEQEGLDLWWYAE